MQQASYGALLATHICCQFTAGLKLTRLCCIQWEVPPEWRLLAGKIYLLAIIDHLCRWVEGGNIMGKKIEKSHSTHRNLSTTPLRGRLEKWVQRLFSSIPWEGRTAPKSKAKIYARAANNYGAAVEVHITHRSGSWVFSRGTRFAKGRERGLLVWAHQTCSQCL